jgi:hypothetical protein
MSTGIQRQDTIPPYPDAPQLAALGNVPAGYRHYRRHVSPCGGLALPGGYLKWYDIHDRDTTIPFNTRDQARDFLRGEAAAGRLRLCDELGFALLHRCAEETYVLAACTWREVDQLWQSTYRRDGDGVFTAIPHGPGHAAVQCLWELGTTGHERAAWARYLGSTRDEAAKRTYLADVFEGDL